MWRIADGAAKAAPFCFGGNLKSAALAFAFLLAHPASAAITLCAGGGFSEVVRHGASTSIFYLLLDPSLYATVDTSARIEGRVVTFEVTLGPDVPSTPPDPRCLFITKTVGAHFEPGPYDIRWNVRRMARCPGGICEVESATFSYAINVAEPLDCTGGMTFDTVPFPAVTGVNIKALHASLEDIPWVLTDPVVQVTGNQILITQSGSYSGPTPNLQTCLDSSAQLGVLAPGHYDVTWQLSVTGDVKTYRDSLDVLASVPTLSWQMRVFLALALTATSLAVLRR